MTTEGTTPTPAEYQYTVVDILNRSDDDITILVRDQEGNNALCMAYSIKKLEENHIYPQFVEKLNKLKEINHKNIPKIYSVQAYGDYIYLFCERVPNATLKEYVLSNGKMPTQHVILIMNQLLSALHCAHSKGVAHNHITLDNIMFDRDMVPVLYNFHLGMKDFFSAVKTPKNDINFCSPEEIKEDSIDQYATDIWHLGVVIYVLCTSKYPFSNTNHSKLCQNILSEEPDYDSIDPKIVVKLKQMLEKDPAKRATAEQLMETEPIADVKAIYFNPIKKIIPKLLHVHELKRIESIIKGNSVPFRTNN
ncbi:CAMK family protein kinase [Trichomonas vaginalis G3]|uniref:CAMK family protein kinase n=1 Tax=Trichomonas vaginalis (strain ATCC PRA-98 / G3) TaxID=412133 RepID=A2EM20_TRIV3|nr:protein serine/threonine kinase protein [Trichomonas vaginalis G3]EAY06279.1 CAMK family protein kinase [Trichomonas vaginalis G3]KAI5503357.1 protein serine/threonine kinase protein [Trichomonas vaginalis G3]|eukprot:XP_001318502.1 CAMK family protein kinase [Trichomonas vaginalis G3]